MRTEYDLEMMQEMGFCSGIENYSRHIAGRPPGSRPYTLLDFLPEGLPAGDRRIARHRPPDRRHVRGRPLAENGAGRTRLPPAQRAGQSAAEASRSSRRLQTQTVYVSATPARRELAWAGQSGAGTPPAVGVTDENRRGSARATAEQPGVSNWSSAPPGSSIPGSPSSRSRARSTT